MSFVMNTTYGGITISLVFIYFSFILICSELIKAQCRALILYVAAGALQEALAVLREAQQPDTAAMFVLACREIHSEIISNLEHSDDESNSSTKEKLLKLPGLDPENEDVIAVGEYYGHYQRKLVHLCMDSQPFSD